MIWIRIGWLVTIVLGMSIFWIIGRTLAGAMRISRMRERNRLFGERPGYGNDPVSEEGISVVVAGFGEQVRIEQWLGNRYTRYEVVWVVDLRTDFYARALMDRYAMTAVTLPTLGELPCEGLRALYRSRERRYRRLLLVDSVADDLPGAFNCGVNVASYDRILAVDGRSELLPGALQTLAIEWGEYGEHTPLAVGGYRVFGLEIGLVRRVSAALRMTFGLANDCVLLFDRDALIRVGGYRDPHNPDGELLRRIRHASHSSPEMLPFAVLRTGNNSSLDQAPIGGRTLFFCLLFFLLLLLFFVLEDGIGGFVTFLLIVSVAWAAAAAVVAISVGAARQAGMPFRRGELWICPLIYPVLLIGRLLFRKNFLSS